ncbi:RCC1-like G exchanging factor-like protein [Anopheles bellator]|uniref:RCC1-like G exchanging factor-like protein n=1 Tax=Anopheles bellator TaxID=139047 RepID=UPI002649E5F2|nr:RCC1-like G exchanging factor-like protein [Anopheles bellator]
MVFICQQCWHGLKTLGKQLSPRGKRLYASSARLRVLRQDVSRIPVTRYPIVKPDDTRVYVWGLAATGALGVQTSVKKQAQVYTDFVQHPSRLSFAESHRVTDVASGYGFTIYAVDPRGTSGKDTLNGCSLWGTGINTDGQLGVQKAPGVHKKPLELLIYPAPIDLTVNGEFRIVRVAAGRAHLLALTDGGTVLTLGNNAYGQCGRRIVPDEDYFRSPTVTTIGPVPELGSDDRVSGVECGQDHSLLVTEAGRVFSCGWSDDGQTGQGRYGLIDTIGPVGGDIEGEKIVKVSSVCDTVLAINDQGELFGWGNSEYGQLGEVASENPQINSPRHLPFAKHCGKIIDIAAAGSYCLALNENGDVFSWGYGILGFGPDVQHQPAPTLIPAALFGRNEFNPRARVISIACGITHSAAITDQHDLYMWGHNRYACLGFGHKNDQFFPLKVAINARVEKITCGVDHTVALCRGFV